MKVSVRRRLRANLLMSTCTSVQLMCLGVGTKESPRDNTLISESESCTVERLMTVSSWSGEAVFFSWERFFCPSYGHHEG